MNIDWHWASLSELSAIQLYNVFAARQAVFVVEQTCAYQDLDGLDFGADHLIGWNGDEVAAYLRILDPGIRFSEPSIGRVLTTRNFRGSGVGRALMRLALERTDARFPRMSVRISAQAHLESFYGSLGFSTASEPYLEDGIPHVEMLRSPL